MFYVDILCYHCSIMQILFWIAALLLISFAYAAAQGAPWVPTWKKDFERIIKLADLKSGEVFEELGCGNARVCRAVAKAYSKPSPNHGGGYGEGVSVVGVELSVLQFAIAWIHSKLSGRKNIRIKFGNAFHQDLKNVDVLYMFLMPETYDKIRSKLEAEMKPGSRVITYVWPIPDWEPDFVDVVEGSQKLFLYKR